MSDEKPKTDPSQPASNPPAPVPTQGAAYTESMIKVLDDVEHVRTRPGMYIGGYNPRGLHHLVYEIGDNSIDEALAGLAMHVFGKINVDGSRTVTDDGGGNPGGTDEGGRPALEIV